jgi:hypothetical protein
MAIEITSDSININNKDIVISDGSQGYGKFLVADASGAVSWKEPGDLYSSSRYIGEIYGGGVIADIWNEGGAETLLIVSKEDLRSTSVSYDPNGSLVSNYYSHLNLVNTRAFSMYDGRLNTEKIISANLSSVGGYTASVAQICRQYRGGGYDDWYLPSYYELISILNNSNVIANSLREFSSTEHLAFSYSDPSSEKSGYWSSTLKNLEPNSGNFVFYLTNDFGGDVQGANNLAQKSKIVAVRKVRSGASPTSRYADGLRMFLDASDNRSMQENSYLISGTSSRWSCIVNSGYSPTYSFALSSSGAKTGTVNQSNIINQVFTGLSPAFSISSGGKIGIYNFTNVDTTFQSGGVTTRVGMHNRNGVESSIVTDYLSIESGPSGASEAYFMIRAFDASPILSEDAAYLQFYISVKSVNGQISPYKMVLDQMVVSASPVGSTSTTIKLNLWQYAGKQISLKIVAPKADAPAHTIDGTKNRTIGPAIFSISFNSSPSAAWRGLGPIFVADEFGGYMRFSATQSGTGNGASFVEFEAPIANADVVTVEMWARLRYRRNAAGQFEQFTLLQWHSGATFSVSSNSTGNLRYRTQGSEAAGPRITASADVGMLDNRWNHYVFEMYNGNYNFANLDNKFYINGESIPGIYSGSDFNTNLRNFNGKGRIGAGTSSQGQISMGLNGDISQFKIYNRALEKSEIVSSFEDGRKKFEVRPEILRDGLYTNIDLANANGDGTLPLKISSSPNNRATAITYGETASILPIPGANPNPSIIRYSDEIVNQGLDRIKFSGATANSPIVGLSASLPLGPEIFGGEQGSDKFTLSVWVKFSALKSATIITRWIGRSYFGIKDIAWELLQSNSFIGFSLGAGSNTVYPYVGKIAIELNTWYNIAATYDQSSRNIRTYINCVPDLNIIIPNITLNNYSLGDVWIGQYPPFVLASVPGGINTLNGEIASFQIYSRALHPIELKNNYDAEKWKYENSNNYSLFFSHGLSSATFSVSQRMVLDVIGKKGEKILTCDANGNARWTDKDYFTSKTPKIPQIGDAYGGGLVVGAWKTTETAMNLIIMSMEELPSSQFDNAAPFLMESEEEYRWDFDGMAASNAPYPAGSSQNIAARRAMQYRGGGYDDWYLPSTQEMVLALKSAAATGYILGRKNDISTQDSNPKSDGRYWTSTQYNSSYAYVMCFSTGLTDPWITIWEKTGFASVRPFRKMIFETPESKDWNVEWPSTYSPISNQINASDTLSPWKKVPWDPSNFTYTTNVLIDTDPFFTSSPIVYSINVDASGFISFTFSNTFTSTQGVISCGVCWSDTNRQPTIANNVVVANPLPAVDPSNFQPLSFRIGLRINGPIVGTSYNSIPNPYNIFFRAFVTTSTGTYYSRNGNYPKGATYSQNLVNSSIRINRSVPSNVYMATFPTSAPIGT